MDASDITRCFLIDDDLLNFDFDGTDTNGTSPYEFEEELEWLDHKDAFLTVESCLDFLMDHSPVSVLENIRISNNLNLTAKQNLNQVNIKARKQEWAMELPPLPVVTNKSSSIGRRCLEFQADKTPQWRVGPMGPKTLCNACGVRYRSGRSRRCLHCQTDKTPQWRVGPMGPKTLCNACGVRYRSGRSRRCLHCQTDKTPQWRVGPMGPKTLCNACGVRYRSGRSRRCLHCQTDKTPQWRVGPMGPKTLCNACGVRYMPGRLVPEYRPANSPTFSPKAYSNSHQKIMEMRRQKVGNDGLDEACGYNMVDGGRVD